MKLNSRTQFINLKKGQWIENENGIFEVTREYQELQSAIGLAEVIFDNEDGTKYHLEDEKPYTTFYDVKGSYILN